MNKLFVVLIFMFFACPVHAGVGDLNFGSGSISINDTDNTDAVQDIMIMDDPDSVSDDGIIIEDHEDLDDIIIEDLDVSEPVAREHVSDNMYQAIDRVWRLINDHADPTYHLRDPYCGVTKKSERKALLNLAQSVIRDHKMDRDKIKAVYTYVAGFLYYDRDCLADETLDTAYVPYDVFKDKKCVCEGYAALSACLLRLVDIPCMKVYGDHHVYNAAYCHESERWIVFDATWGSCNYYENKTYVSGNVNYQFFDMTPSQLAEYSNHEVYYIDGITYKNTGGYYSLETGFVFDINDQKTYTWDDMSRWRLVLSGMQLKNIYVVDEIDDLSVTSIREFSFRGSGLRSIDMADTHIACIENGAFWECKNLVNIKFDPFLKRLGDYAFSDCTKLSSIDLSRTMVDQIRYETFYNCLALKSISFSRYLTKISPYAFTNNYSLVKLDLSYTKVGIIGTCAFENCRNLGVVTFSPVLSSIQRSAFSNCRKLGSISFRKTNLSVIGDSAFSGCQRIKSVCGSRFLKKIKAHAFSDCKKLNAIILYNKKVKIAKTACKKSVKIKYL